MLDGGACRLGDPGEVHEVLGVLGVDRDVPIVVRVLVSWWKEESEEDDMLVVNGM